MPANRMKDGVSFLSYRLFLLDRCHPTTKTANLLIPSFAKPLSLSFQSKLFRRSEHAVLAYYMEAQRPFVQLSEINIDLLLK